MDPQKSYEQSFDSYADLDAHESARWPAAIGHLGRFKRPNLAIMAVTAIVAIDAYRNSPLPSVIYAAFFCIVLLGMVGGRRDG